MEIKVYGREGCAKCTEVKETFEEIIKKENMDKVTVKKVNDMEELVSMGVMSTPAVSVDGDIVFKGKVPSEDEILEVLR